MTAEIVTHKMRRPWPNADNEYGDHDFVVERVCDADAQHGVAYVAPGQLWQRVAEGKTR